MHYLEKVRLLKEMEAEDAKNGYKSPFLIDICYTPNFWEHDEIELLVPPYPWLPQEYIDFIKEFDNFGLAFVTFFGSKKAKGIPLAEELEYWFQYLKGEYFPFAKDADGSVFTFNKNGEVIWFAHEDFECEEPIKVADNFADFIGEYILGKKTTAGTSFYELLQSLGWV
jgi:hypothetical protein